MPSPDALPQVLVDKSGKVATLTLNRPERRNALTDQMLTELGAALDDAERDDSVSVVVLTGAGGTFCAGGDVKDFDAQGGEGGGSDVVDQELVRVQQRHQRATVGRIHGFSKPTIAALPGAVAGAGVGLALAADLRVASSTFVLATAFTKVALSGDYGATWLLQQMIGRSRTLQLMYSSERVDADRALALGLVNKVVPPDRVESVAHDLALTLANGPAYAFAQVKKNVNANEGLGLLESMDDEVERHKSCGITADHQEAVRAFLEERAAVFGASR